MSKNWLANLTYSISTCTTITALTVDHWYVVGAIIGIFSTLITMIGCIYFSRKSDQRAEEQLRQVMSEK